MKKLLYACLLISLQSMSAARAFEADIHYSATYVLARAVGWTETDALIIASANEGVDENPHTVAALEMETPLIPSLAGYATSSLRQAEKNLRFHCFSNMDGHAGEIAADVVEVMSRHFAGVPRHAGDARRNARRLIALGVALHCQQDAHSHVGFGGSCGPHAGSCYGHTHETFFDHVVFRLLGKHYFNPDHPGVSDGRLLGTLEGTARELSTHGPKTSSRSIPTHELVALSDALRQSGLELPDELRRECNRHVAGKWLFDFLRSGGRTQGIPDTVETLAPEVASTCSNDSLRLATVVTIPDPRFPRLNPDGSPYLVRTDGTYQQVHGMGMDASHDHAAEIPPPVPNYHSHKVRIQLSHWRQILALPLMNPRTR